MLRSLWVRAVVALALLVGFYVFSIALVVALFAAPVVLTQVSNRVVVKLYLFCWGIGGAIAWGLIPRVPPFVPPGPEVTDKTQPRLFQVIREIADTMGQRMPEHVYLMPDVNAFVTEVGGFLGFGRRRVMGIGLGLLAVENLSQLRAVIAHEFGHFKGGDTALGALIYRQRGSLIGVLNALSGSFVRKPFEWMMRAFLYITSAISRRQELTADEWSVRIAGKQAHTSGLRLESIHGAGFASFIGSEVRPLAARGVAVHNVFEGYRAYLGSPFFARLAPVFEKEASDREPAPYDTHPPLEERLAFAETLSLPEVPIDNTPAWTLLQDAEQFEAALSVVMQGSPPKVISWDEVGDIHGEYSVAMARRIAARVAELDVARCLRVLSGEDSVTSDAILFATHPKFRVESVSEKTRTMALLGSVQSFLHTVLVQQGGRWIAPPGEITVEWKGNVLPVVLLDSADAAHTMLRQWEELDFDPSWTVQLSDEERTAAARPLSQVEIHDDKSFSFSLGSTHIPKRCAACGEAAEFVVDVDFPFARGDQQLLVHLRVPTCAAHERKATEHFKILAVRDPVIALRAKFDGFAELVKLAND